MSNVPNFANLDLSGLEGTVKTERNFERYLDEGIHACAISSAVYQDRKEDADPNWFGVTIEVEKVGHKPKRTLIMFPINAEGFAQYKGKETSAAMFRNKLANFLESLGVGEVNTDNLGSLIKRFFSDPSKLVGLRIDVEIGFGRRAHPQYQARNTYHLVDGRGNIVKDGDSAMVFDSADSAVAYAKDVLNDAWATKYSDVMGYAPAAQANDLKRFGGTKKAAIVGADDEEAPF